MTKSVTLLGATGSVGTQTLAILRENPGAYRVRALVGGANAALLAEQAMEFGAEIAVVHDEAALPVLAAALRGTNIAAEGGARAVLAAAAIPADWTLSAITGAAGLAPTLAAIARGGAIALACKEALVCAGDVFLAAVRAAGAMLLPVDSEHNAVMQAMADGNAAHVERIVLTASGGPFRTASLAAMRDATPEQALRHPVWSMGAKISIDSATMANKGLELIEAARLFGLPGEKIDVLIHPQSVIHGMACYADGSVLAQLGSPDMRIPLAHALAWPGRIKTSAPRLDLAAIASLTFESPDDARFPALPLARRTLREGGTAPAIYSAANEIAVAAFLDRRLGFLGIVEIIAAVLDALGVAAVATLDDVLAADAVARRTAERLIAARA